MVGVDTVLIVCACGKGVLVIVAVVLLFAVFDIVSFLPTVSVGIKVGGIFKGKSVDVLTGAGVSLAVAVGTSGVDFMDSIEMVNRW